MTTSPDPTPGVALAIEREIRVEASPDTVFSYFVDPERIIRWMGTTATLEPRPGGDFRIDYNGKDIARGTYLVVDPPRRVVFSWGWEMTGDPVPPGASTVEVTLAPSGRGTIVHLRHSGLPPASIDGHVEGWDYFLPTLAGAVAA